MTTPVDIIGKRALFGADCFQENWVAAVSSFLLACFLIPSPYCDKSGKHDFIPLLPRPKELISNLKAANGGRTSFVFNYLDPHTNELRPIRSIQHAFQTACRKAGITGLQFRDLRRTFSTRLHEKGLGLLIIQRLLRHSSRRISAEVYIQTSMRMMKEALEKISSREEKPANLEHGTDGKRQAASKPLVFSELE